MKKGYFYKIDARQNQANPIIEHNIPEELIVNITDFKFKSFERGSYIRRIFLYINQEIFDNIFVNKLIFPTEYYTSYYDKDNYLGSVIIRTVNEDILAFLHKDSDDKIVVRPCKHFKNSDNIGYYGLNSYETYSNIPSRNIKVFLSREEFEKDVRDKKEKGKTRKEKENNTEKKVTKTAPVFSFTTPKFKIVEVVKKTDWLPGIKVGDIIYGEIPVIEKKDNRKFGAMHGIGTLTNWVTIYINGEKSKIISPTIFPQLFFKNIIVEKTK